MKKNVVIIEIAKDGTYSACGDKVGGIWGTGDTPNEAKNSALNGLKLFIANNDEKNIPKELKGKYEIVFRFDVVSLLKYYKGIFTNAALERVTGINQKQLQHYASGLKKPRPDQKEKLKTAFHKLGSELMAVEL